jgi:hypothetical protein
LGLRHCERSEAIQKPRAARLEHRAEKWVPVFGKKDAATRNYSIEPDSEIRFDAVAGLDCFAALAMTAKTSAKL